MRPAHNQGVVDELEEEVVLLQALLNAATGVWWSDGDEDDSPVGEDSLIIPGVK